MYENTEHNIRSFDSITEMAAWADANLSDRRELTDNDSKFYNYQQWSTVTARCAMGHEAGVEPARALMSKLEHGLSVSTDTFASSVAGCFPNVPEYLAGEPECMWDLTPTESENAPLSIYIDLTCSAGITPAQMQKRGIAVLTLTMLLSAVRPVSLHVCTVMGVRDGRVSTSMRKRGEGYSVSVARIETAPLDLARAAYAMTDVAVARRLFYAVGETDGGWPTLDGASYGHPDSADSIKRVREILDLDSETLFIPAVSQYSGEVEQMVEQPVEWLNAKLQQYGGVTAEA